MRKEPQAARPLSGEILLSPVRLGGGVRPEDVVDADYVVIDPPRSDDRPEHVPARSGPAAPAAGMAMLRKGEPVAGHERWAPAGAAFWVFSVILVAVSFWTAGGHALVSR